MRFSVVIATCGDQKWGELAFSRAFPSARDQSQPAPLDAKLDARVGPLDTIRPSWSVEGLEVVIEHHPDLSVSASRNAAAASASGDYLVFLDADDELEPGYIAAMERALAGGAPGWAPLLVPAVRYVQAARVPGTSRWLAVEPAAIPNRGRWPRINECVVGTGIRRSCFDEVGGFREWPSIEDYDLFLRAYDAGADLVYVEDAVYRAHVNPEGRNSDQSCYAAIWADHLGRTDERG